ncbi:LysR family transcriptional regulator [Pseudooceanicola sp. CBS1P-1]|uniref:LysR family transcriptional regulator n=1 Tax=Pseudooceanicola albus TaxID=2692189 RepID=A0A6L7G5E0_9RHOB|nr:MULTISPECIES: LysR family transcriptional regulator [Pseudooceanicola]MBT9385259.1 LysR family transcriptional regulator [Pseudooceanicola endophyticus]MXN18882.1 LysR family transcriptional regulator [Pseudooceanicola albus]
MELRQVRHFEAVARHASFAAAAQQMNLTQPALSKSIRALETDLGVPLFHRSSTGVTLTEFGERFLLYADQVLNLSDDVRGQLDEMRGAKRGSIRIGALVSEVRVMVPRVTKDFLLDHPDVQVDVTAETNRGLLSALHEGRIDIALVSGLQPQDVGLVRTELLTRTPMEIIADHTHPLARRSSVDLKELTEYSWVLPVSGEKDLATLETLFLMAGLPTPEAICKTTSNTFLIPMLEGTEWLSFAPRTALSSFFEMQGLVPLPLSVPTWTREIHAAYRAAGANRPLVRAFLRRLRAFYAEPFVSGGAR